MMIKVKIRTNPNDHWRNPEYEERGPFEVVSTVYDSRPGNAGAIFVCRNCKSSHDGKFTFVEIPVKDAFLVTPLEMALTET